MILDPIFLEGVRTPLEQRCKENVNVRELSENLVAVRMLDAYTIFVDPHEESLGESIATHGYWEFWVTQFLARQVKQGWRVINVGANYGYYVLLFADIVGWQGEVFAFEPNPYLANTMRASVQENEFGNVAIIKRALSNWSGSTKLVIPENMLGSASIKYNFEDMGLPEYSIDVRVDTLDSYNLENIQLIMIDAEGSEADILEGAKETIARNPDMRICMEWLGRRIEDASFIYELEREFNIFKILTTGKAAAPITAHELENGHVDWEMLYMVRR